MKTRKYQDDAILELMSARENGAKSALIVMAPSLGKTFVAATDAQYFLDENPEGKVLYLCHTNEVLNQAKKTFKKVFGDERSYGFYNGITKNHQADFLFASFQTMNSRKAAFERDEFAYIIVDEAHHAPANTFKGVVEYFKPQFLLGLTATPDRLDGLSLSEIFGKVVYSMNLIESIANGYVANVDYRLVLDEMQDISSIIIEGQKLSMAELNRRLFIPKRDEEIVRLIAEKSAERKNARTMIFCRSVEHAENITALISGAEVVHSRIDEKECLRRIARFRKGQTSTIVSVDQLNEGVDIPQADVIVFLRSTVSPVVFYQQLGRGLRLHDEKEGVLVLDFVGNCERLETIDDLYTRITEAQGRFTVEPTEEGEIKEHFTLDINTPKFHESLVDILAKIRTVQWRRGYTTEELISMLQTKAQKLGRIPRIDDVNSDMGMPAAMTFVHHFGSWTDALESAGIDASSVKKPQTARRFTREELISMLQTKAQEIGRTPRGADLNSDPNMPQANTFTRHFGSWTDALESAGFVANQKKPRASCKRTAEELVSMLQLKAQELGRVPTGLDIDNDESMPSRSAFISKFGSWISALEAAGFNNAVKERQKLHYTAEDMIAKLRAKCAELGYVPPARQLNKIGLPNQAAFIKVFGSWNNALKAAGYGIKKEQKSYNKDDLILYLQSKAQELGRVPRAADMERDKKVPSRNVFIRSFGSFQDALRAAGLVS